MQTKRLRGIVMLAPVIFALSVTAGGASAASTSVPVTVQGFVPGYTDSGLTQLVNTCVAEVPASETMANELRGKWQVQVQVQNLYLPHVNTVVRVTLLDGKRVVAFRWKRTVSLDTAPSAAFCWTVSELTQQLWDSVSAENMAPSPPRES
jgi:hypothetical protein